MDLTLLPLADPTETRTFEKGRFEVYEVGPATIGRATYEPGWRWSCLLYTSPSPRDRS